MPKKPYKSIRIFKSDALEWCTHVHPITPLLIWLPVALILFYRSFAIKGLSVAIVGAFSAAGFLVWTFAEYWLHRVVFHFPAKSALGQRFMFIIHGLHHDDPVDPTRLVMPPVAAAIIAVILFGLFRMALGPSYVEPFFAAFLVGYLCYDYVHYAIHHFTPRTSFGKFVKNNHMKHHFSHEGIRWGVSSPLWDYVFGTFQETKRAARHSVSEQHGS